MGFGGISLWQLLIVLVIVLLLFGTKKLKGMGSDLGGAIKGFKKAMDDDDKEASKLESTTVESQEESIVVNKTATNEDKAKR